MVWQRVRFALLAGAIVAAAAHPARAEDAAKPALKPEAQGFCTVKVWECVPETYTCTVYKTENRVEKYTAYKCESVPVEKTRTCTTYTSVPETHVVRKEYTVCVPVCEERTVMKPCYSYRTVTKMVCKTEDHGHWECKEVPSHLGCLKHKLGHFCKKDCCNSGCGDSCGSCAQECVPTRTKRVWVPCKVQVQCPVCCKERVCEMKATTCKVTVMKKECRVRECNVTTCKLVPQTRVEKYTVCETRKVPYEATRCVCVSVPTTVTKTRMVRRCVEKQVAAAPVSTCANDCGNACGATAGCCGAAAECCSHKKHCHHGFFKGLCHKSCSTCCD